MTALESHWWRTSVVGRMDVLTSMEWATHMSIPAVLLPQIPTSPHAQLDYCRQVASMALDAPASQIWIRTSLTEQAISAFDSLSRYCDGVPNVGMILSFEEMDHSSSDTQQNPAALIAKQIVLIHKAIGSQLKAICLPTAIFLTNKRGYPALSKTHQVLFTEVLRRIGKTVRILLEGPSRHTDIPSAAATGKTKCLPYLQYILHLRKRPEISQILDSQQASLEESYLDQLQRPLQPLADQLEFQTYETFEKDPIKYTQYTKAIYSALQQQLAVQAAQQEQETTTTSTTPIIILVVGAGRGPLVRAALTAIQELQQQQPTTTPVPFHIYAIEKNPCAIIFLESMVRNNVTWQNVVTVIHSDMRMLHQNNNNIPQADLVVSELLGSFGDNELSPECLDGLAHHNTGNNIWKETTISIPVSYSAYLAPISSWKLHSEARSQSHFPQDLNSLDGAPLGNLRVMETPYVVRMHAASQTHVEQFCWSFCHPSTDKKKERVAHLSFSPDPTFGSGCGSGYGPYDPAVAAIAQSTTGGVGDANNNNNNTSSSCITIHGLVGTFDAILYNDITISTRPQSFSVGMFSWFPMYFPLREPLKVPGGATVSCSMWRRTDTATTTMTTTQTAGHCCGRVWYEWCVKVTDSFGNILGQSALHNPNGRSCHVKL